MEKINIAELLKDCPKGMELDCVLFDNVKFEECTKECIYIRLNNGELFALTKYGNCLEFDISKCIIYPKNKTTWEGFIPPCKFKDGDIVASNNGDYIFMLKKAHPYKNDYVYNVYNGTCYFGLSSEKFLLTKEDKWYFNRLATEEEKQKLFQAVNANRYRWNNKTKSLERVVEPYTEQIKETMEPITIDDFKANTKEWLIDKLKSMSKDNALQAICNIHDELHKPQYPKTFEECCTILGLTELGIIGGYRHGLLTQFRNLLICRDAYWKIAGEQMGLGKPWEPDWTDNYQKKWTINFYQGEINFTSGPNVHFILAFPTEEMREAFYDNFEELIKECKSLL